MRNITSRIAAGLIIPGLVTIATAHVGLVYPTGGETMTAGDTVTVQWQVVIPHILENWDLYFSPDGGNQWQVLQEDLPTSQLSYKWMVPAELTQQGQIRIVMDNVMTDYEAISGNFTIQQPVLGTPEPGQLPATLTLHANYPNPFNPVTTIRFELPQAARISLIIHDILGREVARLLEGYIRGGYHEVQWNGEDFASGIYVARLVTPAGSRLIRMVLLK